MAIRLSDENLRKARWLLRAAGKPDWLGYRPILRLSRSVRTALNRHTGTLRTKC
jgi:hypothetical protein